MTADQLEHVKLATRKRERAATKLAEAEDAWRATIRDANANGASLRQIAAVAGVTFNRVQQILKMDDVR